MFNTGEDLLSPERFFPGGTSVADTPPGQNGPWNTMFVDFVAVVALSAQLALRYFFASFVVFLISLLRIPPPLFPHPQPFPPSLLLIDTLMPDIKIKSSFLYFLRLEV